MPRKTKEDSRKTRERLLDSAEKLFLEKGVSKTTLEDIAADAGVTRGAVYWHFENKRHIFTALYERMESLLPSVATLDVEDGGNPLAKLADFSVKGLELVFDNPHLLNMVAILNQRYHTDEEAKTILVQVSNQINCSTDEIAAFFERAVTVGLLPERFDPVLSAHAFKAYQMGLVKCFLIAPDRFPLREQIRPLIDIFFQGLYPRTS